MLKHYMHIQIDDEFGAINPHGGFQSTSVTQLPEGILSINGSFATIDTRIFKGMNFYQPVEAVLNSKHDKLEDLKPSEFLEIMNKFGKFKLKHKFPGNNNIRPGERIELDFEGDNFHDLEHVFLVKAERVGFGSTINFSYRNCPVNSFYLMDEKQGSDMIKINISPFTQNYYDIEEYQWNQFLAYLKQEIPLSEVRNQKLEQIFDEAPAKHFNLIRQAKFFQKIKGNRFVGSVLDFYDKKGYITDKQFDVVAKTIW